MITEEKPLEDLGFDRNRRLSSGPRVKSGPNRGRRHVERGGKWEYVDGYVSGSYSGSERRAHYKWAHFLKGMGHRVGECWYEGVKSFYVWVPEGGKGV